MASKIYAEVVPELLPIISALAISSGVVLLSNFFSGVRKVNFQVVVFAALLALVIAYIMASADSDLSLFWNAFTKLSYELRFSISVLVVVSAYFGGGFYVVADNAITVQQSSSSAILSLETPASCDKNTDFVIPASVPSDDKELFETIFTTICTDIVADLPTIYEMPKEAVEWVDKMLAYTVAGGKMNRGLSVMSVQKTFASTKGKTLSAKERCQSAALGWCVEFLQAFFLVADDVMDDSVTRRGQPCWFRLKEVKLIAINDSFILESCVYKILKQYFGKEAYYPQLVDIFIEVTRQTELGQLLDLTSQPLGGPLDLNRFTIERYTAIVQYKTAFYSFYLPVALGMIVSGITDPTLYNKAREILLIMGEYFQVQDDYLDCYGAPEDIGKIGTDIQDSKCSWLVVQALDMATTKHRRILEDNYGQHDQKKVQKVKKLYIDLDLKSVFEKYEEESYKKIIQLLDEVTELPREVFEFLLRKIYKRSK
eukprot:gene8502-11494_t